MEQDQPLPVLFLPPLRGPQQEYARDALRDGGTRKLKLLRKALRIMLTQHFDLSEFEKDGAVPPACLPVVSRLAQEILEPIRDLYGPLVITSGYRPPLANADAHGQPNSEHIYTAAWAACDFYPTQAKPREVFDWCRNNPALPYHQLILEHGANGSSVVHVSINVRMPGVRSVLEGATHNSAPYAKVDHVGFMPLASGGEVNDAQNG